MNRFLKVIYLSTFILMFTGVQAASVLNSDWDDVARGRADEQKSASWWSSDEAKRIAENVMVYQKNIGGWEKNIYELHQPLSATQRAQLIAGKTNGQGCTIDNGAVYYELTYLSRVYGAISNEPLKTDIYNSFELAIEYLLRAQYTNGGWPQFYPYRGGYSDDITYNDDAMVNVLEMIYNVATKNNTFTFKLNDEMAAKAQAAYNKGIECILKTQYIQNGLLTSWCAQHDYETLEPSDARSYELASLSGQESEGILNLLMSIDEPSEAIKRAIFMGARWYDDVKITGQRLEDFYNSALQENDKRIVQDPNAPDMWARFYTLEDNTPFFCSRDGIKRYSIAEISHERRNGYSWYSTSGGAVKSSYGTWTRRHLTTFVAYPISDSEFDVEDSIRFIAESYKYRYTLQSFDITIDGNLAYSFNTEQIDTVLTGLRGGTHQIIATAKYDRDYSSSDTVYVTITGDNVNVNDNLQSEVVQIYPNPTSDQFQIDLNSLGNAKIEIFDLSGKSVYQSYKSKGIHMINVNHLDKGQYIVRVTSGNQSQKALKLMVN